MFISLETKFAAYQTNSQFQPDISPESECEPNLLHTKQIVNFIRMFHLSQNVKFTLSFENFVNQINPALLSQTWKPLLRRANSQE